MSDVNTARAGGSPPAAGGDPPPSDAGRQQRWQQLRAGAVALAEVFEQRSLQRYEHGEFVAQNVADLREAGLTALNVPADMGGVEASLAENVDIIKILSGGCGSAGFTFAIHAILTGR